MKMEATPRGNAEWLARSRAAVWHPCTQMKVHETLPLVPIARGDGAWLYDFDGHRYLDAIGSWWVNLFGHANARINAAVGAQLASLEHEYKGVKEDVIHETRFDVVRTPEGIRPRVVSQTLKQR